MKRYIVPVISRIRHTISVSNWNALGGIFIRDGFGIKSKIKFALESSIGIKTGFLVSAKIRFKQWLTISVKQGIGIRSKFNLLIQRTVSRVCGNFGVGIKVVSTKVVYVFNKADFCVSASVRFIVRDILRVKSNIAIGCKLKQPIKCIIVKRIRNTQMTSHKVEDFFDGTIEKLFKLKVEERFASKKESPSFCIGSKIRFKVVAT